MQRDQRVGRARLGVGELGPLHGANRWPNWSAVKCAASARRDDSGGRRGALGRVPQPGDPRHPVVVAVPQRAEHAARGEHPGDLRQRAGQVEPVQRLRAEHRVHRPVGQRDRLRRAAEGAHRRQPGGAVRRASPRPAPPRSRRRRARRAARSACRSPRRGRARAARRCPGPSGATHHAHRVRRVVRPVLGVRGGRRAERRSAPGPLARSRSHDSTPSVPLPPSSDHGASQITGRAPRRRWRGRERNRCARAPRLGR